MKRTGFHQGLYLAMIFVLILSTGLQPVSARSAQLPAAQTAQLTLPVVAVHDSELTRALAGMPASGTTPIGTGTTGYQWWQPWWNYSPIVESIEEALRSDGIPFVVVTDAEIEAGALRNPDGSPRYPILISLAAEAVSDAEIMPLRSYVQAGGFLLAGSSSFTRYPDGSPRGNFALAAEMGLNSTTASLQNWVQNLYFTKAIPNRMTAHLPSGTLTWTMPQTSDEAYFDVRAHYVWRVTANGAEVLANGEAGPILATRTYGSGRFVYFGLLQPLIGHGGYDVGMYSYLIFREAVKWAFEARQVPMLKLSAWPYAYDAAFNMRHDFENIPSLIQGIESSAQYEASLGVLGDYYFTTGVVRAGSEDNQLSESQKAAAVQSLRRAVLLYDASIGSHNGGLPNPVIASAPSEYPYWHWGPDEALNTTPAGYASGSAYALASIQRSFNDIAGWLTGLDNGRTGCGTAANCPRLWVSPAFMSTREGSYDILNQLGVAVVGEQKLGIFPHKTLSNTTSGKQFSMLSLPVSEWFINGNIAQALDYHTTTTAAAAVDFYYDQGAFINLYGHNVSNDSGATAAYLNRVLSKPRVWSTNAVGIFDWWNVRSAVTVTPSYRQESGIDIVSAAISGATDPQTTIEVELPNYASWGVSNLQVLVNGTPVDSSAYRFTKAGIKIRTGTAASVEVRYLRSTTSVPIAGACYGEETGAYNVGIISGWNYRQSLQIQNTSPASIPAGYTVKLTLNTAALVAAGKMRADGNDLRVAWVSGSTLTELDRLPETAFNQTATELSFKIQAAIPANTTDGSYFLYYGNPAAGAAPTNPSNVYAFWDSFDGTALNSAWRVTSGTASLASGEVFLPAGSNIASKQTFLNAQVEMRLRLDQQRDFAWWGMEELPNDSPNFIVFQETDTTFYGWSRRNGADTSRSLARPANGLTNWHTYLIDWYGNGVTWRIDGSQAASITSGAPNQAIALSVYAYSVPVRVDWIKVKLRAAIEPVVSVCPGGSVPTPTPTPTSVVPTATPTATAVVPTPTGAPPTALPTFTPTPTLPVPTSTFTPLPPTATPTITSTPAGVCTGEESGSFQLGAEGPWNYRASMSISNPGAAALPAGYSVRMVLDTASLLAAGKMRADGNDLRVVWYNGSAYIQLDRVAETAFNSSTTEIWFRLQSPIPAGGSASNYYIYYGNPGSGLPPANRENVYMLWDDFNGATLNNSLWSVSTGSPVVSGGLVTIPVSANIFGRTALSSVEIVSRLRMGTQNEFAWWGMEATPLNGDHFIVFEETSDFFYAWNRANGMDSSAVLADPAGGLTSLHTYTIRWLPGNVTWLIDGQQVAARTINVPSVPMYASVYGYGSPVTVDWIRVRSLAVVEPVVQVCTGSISTPTSTPLAPTPTATPLPPTPTDTPTALAPTATPLPPTPTPTATQPPPTPTPTTTPGPQLIFTDGYESGSFSAWTASVTDIGDLSVSGPAALTGGFGLQAFIDDNVAIYLTDDTPLAERQYQARFRFDPNSIVMISGNAHYLFYGYTGPSTIVLRLELRYSSGQYQLRGNIRNDSNTWINTAWITLSDAAHLIEVDWRAATAVNANNGTLSLVVDGVSQPALTTVDNDTRRIDRVRLGPVGGIDTGTRGTYYLDDFASYR